TRLVERLFSPSEGLPKARLIVRRQHYHYRCRVLEGLVEHFPDVWTRLSCRLDSLTPLNRLETDGSQEGEHRPPHRLVATVNNEDPSSVCLRPTAGPASRLPGCGLFHGR